MSEPPKTLSSSESSLPTAAKPPPQELTTTAPHDNDVLCGRGGTVNAHPGNEQYRKFVDSKKRLYLTARFKREKRLISGQIVDQVRNLDPPGRFLMKDSANPSTWHDIGDEKARDKTSQALRETALTVRRQLEEDFRKAQQANAALAGVATKGPPIPPPPDSSAGPMGGWRSQPPIQQQQQQSQPPPPYWAYQQPYDPNYPPQQEQQPTLQRRLVNSPVPNYPYFAQPSLKQPPEMQQQQQHQPTYYNYEGMSSQYQWSAQQQLQQQHQPHQGQQQQQWGTQQQASQYTTNNQFAASVAQQQQQQPVDSTTQQPTTTNLRPASIFRTTLGGEHRHVQFQTTTDTQQQQQQEQQSGFGMDVPLVISPMKRMHPRKTQYSLEWDDGPTISPSSSQVVAAVRRNADPPVSEGWNDVGTTMPLNDNYVPSSIQRVNTLTSSQAGDGMSLGGGQSQHTAATQATPLTFLSTNFSFNLRSPMEDDRDMELSEYLQGIEDEMYGDVGQEVELVAHAPLFMGGNSDTDPNQQHRQQQQQQQHHGVPRSTPPRPYGSGGSRSGASYRKRRSGTHIPSNSGKVQLDLSTLGGHGSSNSSTGPASSGGSRGVAADGGGRGLQTEVAPSPSFSPQISTCGDLLTPNSPVSPGYSLDLDKMSLCGTENISQAGGSLGGASLCNVFDDPTLDSPEAGTTSLMDGSLPSEGTRGTSGSENYDAQFGLGPPQPRPMTQSSGVSAPEFGENESLMGTSARMDMSVDSGPHSGSSKQSSSPSKGQNSSSDCSSRGSSMTRRSGSPSSIDKASFDGGGDNREDQTIAEETQTIASE